MADSKNLKILCVIDDLSSGGAQRQLVNIALELQLNGFYVEFLIYHDNPFYEDFLNLKGIKVNLILESNRLKRLMKFIRFIKRGDYHGVISFLEAANFICSMAKLFTPKTRLIVGERSSNPRILRSIKLILYRYVHFIPNYVVANSHANIKMIQRVNPFLSKRKLKVVYNSIDFEIWKRIDSSVISSGDSKLCILVASTHQYLKNLNNLIEAVNLLDSSLKSKLFIKWYGDNRNDGSYEAGIKKIREFGLTKNFIFNCAISDIKSEMINADVIGLFSFYEGLPNAICEAMALAKPVLCTNVSDMPLLLDEKQLVNANDILDIRNKLLNIINTPRDELRKLGEKNYNIAVREFSKDIIVRQYLDLLS